MWQRGTAIGGLVSVLLVAVGLYLTNGFNRDQFRLQQDSTERQQELAIDGQRADRFVKAIDQLGQEGNEKLGIRLGGIYALETLMRDSPKDENTIIEVLCAFIRTHAPFPKIIPDKVPESPFDVRAALAVLGRRPDPGGHTYLDFSNTLLGLDGVDLANANLRSANLRGADLTDAILTGAYLRSTNLSRTKLSWASLIGADLEDADLTGADLTGADLTGAHLHPAKLTGAHLRRADFTSADLRNANLTDVDMAGVDLENANLRSANLANANLRGADLMGADLYHANLFSADLRGANLKGADLSAVNLGNADLADANLTCTTMTDATSLPPGVARSAQTAHERPECQQ